MKLSAIVLTKNEEAVIADCLENLSFCDEIIVVDTGSTDRTRDIASMMKARVFDYKTDDFSQMRMYGLKQAKGEWVLYIDADEKVTKELQDSILSIIMNETSITAYCIRRKNYYFQKYLWPHDDVLERLFKRDTLQEWYGKVHETPRYIGKLGQLKGDLLHYSHRNLSSMLAKTIIWSEIEAQLRYDANHPPMTWWRFPRVMMTAFYDSYIRKKGWKIGIPGLVEAIFQSFSMFITYARLWEKQYNK